MISKYGILCKVAETGSFTRVAEEIGYSQSAVSQSVKALEQELDCVLFYRQKKGLTLTRDGETYLPYIRAIYAAERGLEQKYREVQGMEDATVRVGCFSSVYYYLLPQLMKAFHKQHPGVHFSLLQGDYDEIRNWILDGTIDFGFTRSDMAEHIEVQPLFQDNYLAMVPSDHPLAKQPDVTLAQLAEYPLLLMNDFVMLQAFQAANLALQIEVCFSDDRALLDMVQEGMGITVLSSLMAPAEDSGLVAIPLREPIDRVLSLAWRSRQTMPRAAQAFAAFIQKNAATMRRKP